MKTKLQNELEFRKLSPKMREAFLAYHGITKAEIARRLNVTGSAVRQAISGHVSLDNLLIQVSRVVFEIMEELAKAA